MNLGEGSGWARPRVGRDWLGDYEEDSERCGSPIGVRPTRRWIVPDEGWMRELGSDVPEEASRGGAQGGGREATLRVLAGLFAFSDIIMLTYLLIMGALVW